MTTLVQQGRSAGLSTIASRPIPKSMQAAHMFIRAGTENREWAAMQAYRGNVPWEYSIPLSSVVAYLGWRGPA